MKIRKINDIARLPVRFYKAVISPLTPPCCRFYPTCSSYAAEALRRHGFIKGSMLAIWRLMRCHPYAEGKWHDPVPKRFTPCALFGYKRRRKTQKRR